MDFSRRWRRASTSCFCEYTQTRAGLFRGVTRRLLSPCYVLFLLGYLQVPLRLCTCYPKGGYIPQESEGALCQGEPVLGSEGKESCSWLHTMRSRDPPSGPQRSLPGVRGGAWPTMDEGKASHTKGTGRGGSCWPFHSHLIVEESDGLLGRQDRPLSEGEKEESQVRGSLVLLRSYLSNTKCHPALLSF